MEGSSCPVFGDLTLFQVDPPVDVPEIEVQINL